MPIKIPNDLPARTQLESENIFVMPETRAMTQDIRPLKVAILNLMPEKIVTETQLLRLLGNTPLQVDIELLKLTSHTSKTTPQKHLLSFYKPYAEIRDRKFDGFIITGAPVEHLEFEKVGYWRELCEIMDWTLGNTTSTLHICWGAQAGLLHHYGIGKIPLPKKAFGVFPHQTLNERSVLMRGFDSIFYAPHSRWSAIDEAALKAHGQLDILAASPDVGTHIVAAQNYKQIFVLGHMEYDVNTLATEYSRDVKKGLGPGIPYNYFPGNNPLAAPVSTWRAHANLFFSNWLNYCVYQTTPYDFAEDNQNKK